MFFQLQFLVFGATWTEVKKISFARKSLHSHLIRFVLVESWKRTSLDVNGVASLKKLRMQFRSDNFLDVNVDSLPSITCINPDHSLGARWNWAFQSTSTFGSLDIFFPLHFFFRGENLPGFGDGGLCDFEDVSGDLNRKTSCQE